MTRYNILIFPIGDQDTAGNKRLKNLAKYVEIIENISVKITPIFSLKEKDSDSSVKKRCWQFYYFLFNIFRVVYVIFKERKKGHINILYFYEGYHMSLHRLLIAKLLGYKVLIDIVENPDCLNYVNTFSKKVRTIYFLLLYRGFRIYIDGVIVVSSFLRDKIVKDFNDKIPVFHMPVTYDPDNFKGESIPFNFPTIFYGGSYGSNYDFESLFKAFNNTIKEFPDLKLFLSGKIDEGQLNKMQGSHNLKDNIKILGFLEEKEYYSTIKNMDILSMPRNNTIQANAGFPFKLAEYLATGRPVITSNVSDVRDYITEDEAYIYTPGDSTSIERMIKEILINYQEALVIGRKGKNKAQLYFDSKIVAKNFYLFILSISS